MKTVNENLQRLETRNAPDSSDWKSGARAAGTRE